MKSLRENVLVSIALVLSPSSRRTENNVPSYNNACRDSLCYRENRNVVGPCSCIRCCTACSQDMTNHNATLIKYIYRMVNLTVYL